MNAVLERWNTMEAEEAAREVLPCCGSRAWADGLVKLRPFAGADAVVLGSARVWQALPEEDWDEAFRSHPRIGERKAQGAVTASSLAWSGQEQGQAMSADEAAKTALAEGNAQYEERFGRIFIVCASGRGAEEILGVLERRMGNDPSSEVREAAEEQSKITELRLRRWLGSAG